MSTLNMLLVEPDSINRIDELVSSGNYVGTNTMIDLDGVKKLRILVEVVKDNSFHTYVAEMNEHLEVVSVDLDVIKI